MTTFTQWRSPGSRPDPVQSGGLHKKYDMRVVDQFYVYCQAVARTERHRHEAHRRAHAAVKRSFWGMIFAGSLLFYYLVDRVAQAMSLY